nr:hypothetical protein [Frigidibacter albus]
MAAALMLGGAAQAAGPVDPDWPCIQRRVPHLSLGQVWAGPLPDPAIEELADTAPVQGVARALALRRTPMPEAEALIAGYAETADAAALTALFVATLEHIDASRDRVLVGITRYAHKQADLDQHIEEARREFAALTEAESQDFDRLDALEADIDWSTRIFLDRQQSLIYVCETPVILEQRAFALGRAVMAHLP